MFPNVKVEGHADKVLAALEGLAAAWAASRVWSASSPAPGSGIGRASALAFAAEGACVVAADLNVASAERNVTDDRAHRAGPAARSKLTSRTPTQVGAMLQHAVDKFGRLDVLFNNAGLPQAVHAARGLDGRAFERIMAVNVRGVFNGCRAAIPRMKAQGGGVILNTASTAGIRPRPGLAIYNASQGGGHLADQDAGARGGAATAFAWCRSARWRPTRRCCRRSSARNEDEARQRFIATVPWGRLNTPEDLAHAAVFLASPEAEMVTGTAFEVDGGRDI